MLVVPPIPVRKHLEKSCQTSQSWDRSMLANQFECATAPFRIALLISDHRDLPNAARYFVSILGTLIASWHHVAAYFGLNPSFIPNMHITLSIGL